MTKIVKVIVLLFLLFPTARAFAQQSVPYQPGRHEVNIGYGWNTVQEMQALFADIFGNNTEAGGNGAISAGYRYHVSKKWAIGISGVTENIKVVSKNSADGYHCKTWAAMADVQYHYIQKKILRVYSGLYAGYGHFKTNRETGGNYSTVAFHATALGIRIGKKIGVFGEIGFGYRGVINTGVSVRF